MGQGAQGCPLGQVQAPHPARALGLGVTLRAPARPRRSPHCRCFQQLPSWSAPEPAATPGHALYNHAPAPPIWTPPPGAPRARPRPSPRISTRQPGRVPGAGLASPSPTPAPPPPPPRDSAPRAAARPLSGPSAQASFFRTYCLSGLCVCVSAHCVSFWASSWSCGEHSGWRDALHSLPAWDPGTRPPGSLLCDLRQAPSALWASGCQPRCRNVRAAS